MTEGPGGAVEKALAVLAALPEVELAELVAHAPRVLRAARAVSAAFGAPEPG
ncbi:hypothetical protein M8C13_24610 [Crossiella sp. SN42]|uniref:hypothetical protein n=1 Tax=Crossiella sp. SN42 TaxID=2944808 RepID=UPI00207D1DE9|nr:hypothetical protein [Crossiella sp. SN42]MCO1578942.1 hypothetical protein [Crossiella sp. SN42]